MSVPNVDVLPPSETFGQDASFRLEQPVGSMSISPSGRDVVLASKEGLHIIDLDSPWSPPRYLPHRTSWEVADVQWSPFAIRDYWIVSTSNQKALVWNVGIPGWRDAIEFVLHGHTRAITDINFSAYHPDMLATCAVDSFVHGWDLRAPARPVFSFSDWFAGATQVKWSRQDEHVIASSHDRFLHIWDRRKGAFPARTIEAHETKIYGIDWNRFEPSKIVTCSLDKTVKFWNTDDPRDVPERVVETPFPVWRARHTPFGWGLLAMPQRGSSDLHLYDRRPIDGVLPNGHVPPVATFNCQKGQVKEFLWRARGTIVDGVDHRDFQLVSWSTDSELRLHKVDEETFNAIGFEKGVSRPQRVNFTRRNARYRTFRDDIGEPFSPLEFPGRADSNQSHSQSLGVRSRPSTNIGMSKIAVAQFRGWLHGGKRGRRTGMHGRSTVRQDTNPISWMKNVKIASWDQESLGDEINQVGQKFNFINVESFSMEQRKATILLQGPWGEAGSMVYVRTEMRFPKTYPREAPAAVSIYKSSSIDEETHNMISTEVNTISEVYANRGRGCVEAIVRYLLHEQSMEQIVSWLLGEHDPKLLSTAEIPEDLSSDSDDDNLAVNPDPSSSSANIRVPLAKGCGALWSPTGELVCFFPQKAKEPDSVLSGLGFNSMSDLQSNRLFEGFGRLQTSSPARRQATSTQPTVDEDSSEVSDTVSTFSSSSSSSSSSESESGAAIPGGYGPYRGAIELAMRRRSRSADRSNKSTTLDGTKAGQERPLNMVTIRHDMKDLLPSQKVPAEQYRINGSGVEVCEHNASIAERSSLPDVASVWHLMALILQQKVPLEILNYEASSHDVAVVARRAMSSIRRKDSGVDLHLDNKSQPPTGVPRGNVKWGNSPLGPKYLITAILNHYEKRADVQMLAMISCMLLQHQYPSLDDTARHGQARSSSMLTSYYPSPEAAHSILYPQDPSSSRFTLAVTRPVAAERLHDQLITSALREPHSQRRATASVAFRPESIRDDESGNRDVSITVDSSSGGTSLARTSAISTSLSPDESRNGRRTNSSVAFAASRASLNALAQSFQHSPPSNSSTAGSSLKKFSPSVNSGWAGSLFGSTQTSSRLSRASQAPSEANSDEASNSNLRGSISFANLQELRDDRMSRGSMRSSTAVGGDNAKKGRRRLIRTSLHNQNQFDIDNYPQVPLVDPELQWKHRMYRLAYADQLGSWGLFHEQAEILKLDGIKQVMVQSGYHSIARATPRVPKLEITPCCGRCENPYTAIERNRALCGWHCTAASCQPIEAKLSKSQVCSICERVVQGLSIPCLQCGHLTCYQCAQGWFVQPPRTPDHEDHDDEDDEDDGETSRVRALSPDLPTCPTGCGCACPTLQTISVPYPAVPLATTTTSATTTNTSPSLTTHDTPTPSPRFPPDIFRQPSSASVRSTRHKSEAAPPGPETALGAMMALSRSRAASTTASARANAAAAVAVANVSSSSAATSVEDDSTGAGTDDLVPWASGKFTSLGRGIGGGLSRGLSNRSSDATIRRA